MKFNIPIIIYFILLFHLETNAQNRFKAGAMMGLNFAQIQGDLQQGYNKLGLSAGIKGGVGLQPNLDLSVELLYNNRGAKYKSDIKYRDKSAFLPDITLHYADMVGVVNYLFSPNNELNRYNQSLHFGFSFGRLIKSKTLIIKDLSSNLEIEQLLNQNYKSNDLSLIVGWSYFITSRLGITARHSVSLTQLYTAPPSVTNTEKNVFSAFRPFSLSLKLFYNFISPKTEIMKKKKNKKNEIDLLEKL